MSLINITINAENPAQARMAMLGLLGQEVGLITSPAKASAPAKEEPPAAGETTESPKAETTAAPAKAKGSKSAKGAKAEAPEPEKAPAAETSDEADMEGDGPATRDDLVQTIKKLHGEKGDAFLPKMKTVFVKYGAQKQSEVKDEDLGAVIADLIELAA